MPIYQLLFRLEGRISRSTFWTALAAYFGLAFIVGIVVAFIQIGTGDDRVGDCVVPVFQVVAGLLMFAVLAKRAHDRNHPGWYPIVIGIIPFIGPLWLLIELGFMQGTIGPNKYGEDPVPSRRLLGTILPPGLGEEPPGSPGG